MHDTSYYLDSFLAPLEPWLTRSDVTDIWINKPGELWIETVGGGIECHRDDQLTLKLLERLARQIASFGSQGISRAQPLLAASLPDGSRVQIVGPPVAGSGYAFAIRRHVESSLTLADWAASDAFAGLTARENDIDRKRTWRSVDTANARATLQEAVNARKNIVISGGTSTGKTTFLNALLAEIPEAERLVLIENAQELRVKQPNTVGLIAARGELSEADATADDLLVAALRMRPDRIILGELRGQEAFTFLRAINTGHPGSMTTIHADTPQRAIEQLALLVLQSGSKLTRDDVRHYIRESIDLFVQLERRNGRRVVAQILRAL